MFAHVSIGVLNLSHAVAFYDDVLKALGYSRLFGNEEEGFMAYGSEESFFIINTPLEPERGQPVASNGTHICFRATSRSDVDNFYQRAIQNGGSCAGEPGIRKEYSPTYYAAYIYDRDGHKIEAVCSCGAA